MRLIVCVDERGGMTFNQRRQSRDRLLCEDVLSTVRKNNGRLYLAPYSEMLFAPSGGDVICSCPDYLQRAGAQDFCFCEREALLPYETEIRELIVYRWNRHYPSDRKLELDLSRFRLQESSEFAGSSHEIITKEVYVR